MVFLNMGPYAEKKMLLELKRLFFLADALRSKGFNRAYGDCLFRVFRRHGEFRFVPDGGGYHRTVVMAALGYPWISARFFLAPALIDVDEAEYWPQVRRGVWTKAQAIAYFNHLFDYNSRDWVRQQTGLLKYSGLITPTPSETGLTAACRT